MDTITLKNVIEYMDSGQHFSIAFVTFNTREKTGGEWIEYDHGYKSKFQKASNNSAPKPIANKPKRDPKHYENSTRNVVVLPEGNIVKIHLRLIRRFNSKEVL